GAAATARDACRGRSGGRCSSAAPPVRSSSPPRASTPAACWRTCPICAGASRSRRQQDREGLQGALELDGGLEQPLDLQTVGGRDEQGRHIGGLDVPSQPAGGLLRRQPLGELVPDAGEAGAEELVRGRPLGGERGG